MLRGTLNFALSSTLLLLETTEAEVIIVVDVGAGFGNVIDVGATMFEFDSSNRMSSKFGNLTFCKNDKKNLVGI